MLVCAVAHRFWVLQCFVVNISFVVHRLNSSWFCLVVITGYQGIDARYVELIAASSARSLSRDVFYSSGCHDNIVIIIMHELCILMRLPPGISHRRV